jgi:hypothetical protein
MSKDDDHPEYPEYHHQMRNEYGEWFILKLYSDERVGAAFIHITCVQGEVQTVDLSLTTREARQLCAALMMCEDGGDYRHVVDETTVLLRNAATAPAHISLLQPALSPHTHGVSLTQKEASILRDSLCKCDALANK